MMNISPRKNKNILALFSLILNHNIEARFKAGRQIYVDHYWLEFCPSTCHFIFMHPPVIQFNLKHRAHKVKAIHIYPCQPFLTNIRLMQILIHMFWSCPSSTEHKFVGARLEPDPQVALSRFAGDEVQRTPVSSRDLTLTSPVARHNFLLKWKKVAAPTQTQYLADIMDCQPTDCLKWMNESWAYSTFIWQCFTVHVHLLSDRSKNEEL